MELTPDEEQMARRAVAAFGGSDRVQLSVFTDHDDAHGVVLIECGDAPAKGVTTTTTLTAHRSPNLVGEADLRVEVLGMARDGQEDLSLVIGAAGLVVVARGVPVSPGVVLLGLVTHYLPELEMPHLYLTAPAPFPDLGAVELDADTTVHWLMGFPIHPSEAEHISQAGPDAFEQLLEARAVPVWDLHRPPVV